MCWHFACLKISTLCLSASLLKHCQWFPRKVVFKGQYFLIHSQMSRECKYTPKGAGIVFDTLPREKGVYWKI